MAEANLLINEKIILAFSERDSEGAVKRLFFSTLRGVQTTVDLDGGIEEFQALLFGTRATFFFIDAKEEAKRMFKTFNRRYPVPKIMDFGLALQVLNGGLNFYPAESKAFEDLDYLFLKNDFPKEVVADMLNKMLDLYKVLLEPMKQFSTVLTIESDAIPAFAEMEFTGFSVDPKRLEEIKSKYKGSVANAHHNLANALGEGCPRGEDGMPTINWQSPAELLAVLKANGVQVKDPSGKVREIQATNQTEVSMIYENDEIRDAIKHFREAVDTLNKCSNKQLEEAGLSKSKKVKPTFNQIGAPTGRNSIEKPSLSSLPSRMRGIIKAGKDEMIITGDYDQCELRILTHLSRDPALTKAFAVGVDIHNFVASEIFDVPVPNNSEHPNYPLREKAKGVNYGLSYGQTTKGLAIELGVSIEEATDIYNRHKTKFRTAHDCLNYLGQQSFALGYSKSIAGRMRFFDKENSDEWEIRRQGMNMSMQGTSADMIKLALGKLWKVRESHRIDFVIWNTTYDSISLRAPTKDNNHQKVIMALKTVMEGAMKSIIPSVPPKVSVQMGERWQ